MLILGGKVASFKEALEGLRDPGSGCWCSGVDGHSTPCLQAMEAFEPGAALSMHEEWLAKEARYLKRALEEFPDA